MSYAHVASWNKTAIYVYSFRTYFVAVVQRNVLLAPSISRRLTFKLYGHYLDIAIHEITKTGSRAMQ